MLKCRRSVKIFNHIGRNDSDLYDIIKKKKFCSRLNVNYITSDNHNIVLLNLYKQTYFMQFIETI